MSDNDITNFNKKVEINAADTTTSSAVSDHKILYITLAIIIGLFLLWIIIISFTKEDSIKILGEMNNLAAQIAPITDNNILPTSNTPITDNTLPTSDMPIIDNRPSRSDATNSVVNSDPIIVPEGYIASINSESVDPILPQI